MSDKKATKNTQKRAARGGCSASPCSACGQKPRRKVDYGDFSEYEVRCLVAEYCMSVTLGCTGWGVDFKTWVELRGIAKHDGLFRLKRLHDAEHCQHCGSDQMPMADDSCRDCGKPFLPNAKVELPPNGGSESKKGVVGG